MTDEEFLSRQLTVGQTRQGSWPGLAEIESTRDKRVDICNSKAPRAIISSSVTRVSLRVAI